MPPPPRLTISSAPLITPHRMLQYLSSLYSSGSSTKSARGLSARIWRGAGGQGGQCQGSRCAGGTAPVRLIHQHVYITGARDLPVARQCPCSNGARYMHANMQARMSPVAVL